jgi:hypothetical protein
MTADRRASPIALAPSAPESLAAAAPTLPQAARDRVAGDVDSLFPLLAIVSLVVGAIGIANVTLVTVRSGRVRSGSDARSVPAAATSPPSSSGSRP